MREPAGRCLIDTNVLIYATLSDDARHLTALRVLEWARQGSIEAVVSVQNLAEMFPNLTGPKRKPPDAPELARRKIESIARLRYLSVLPITPATVLQTLALCAAHGIRQQDYFDAQLAATMLEHEVPTVITEDPGVFSKFAKVHTYNPFR